MVTPSNKTDVTLRQTIRHVISMRVRGSQHVPCVFASATTMARPGAIVPALAAEAAGATGEVLVLRSRVRLILEEADYFLVIRVTEWVLRKSCWLVYRCLLS